MRGILRRRPAGIFEDMSDTQDQRDVAHEIEAAPDQPGRIGDQLRAARETRGLSREDIAKETRIPLRHLDSIERSDFSAIPGKTYAVGFVKAYARAIDFDEVAAAEEVRREYDYFDNSDRSQYQAYQPADPSRVPSRSLAWIAAIVAIVLAVAYGVWRLDYFAGGPVDPYAERASQDAAPGFSDGDAAAAPAAGPGAFAADAPVVLTANDLVWFRIDGANGDRIHEQELPAGQSYTVAQQPGLVLQTARPQALDITVGGQRLKTLGAPDTLVKNVPLAAQALVARANAGP